MLYLNRPLFGQSRNYWLNINISGLNWEDFSFVVIKDECKDMSCYLVIFFQTNCLRNWLYRIVSLFVYFDCFIDIIISDLLYVTDQNTDCAIPVITNSTMTISGNEIGDFLIVKCFSGFSMQGPSVLQCVYPNVWNTSLPSCSGMLLYIANIFSMCFPKLGRWKLQWLAT